MTPDPAAAEHRRTLWWATANARPVTVPVDAGRRLDVAVIGAGFTGLTAALHLARRGVRVGVFEADEVGSGASGLNAGFVVPNFAKADPEAVIARLGQERGRRLLDAVGAGADRVFAMARDEIIVCDAEQEGWLQIAHDRAMLPRLEARARAWAALGRPVSLLGEAEARSLTGARRCFGALFDASGGMLHPLNYAYGLAHAAIAAGAAIHEHATVASVEPDGSGWRLATAAGPARAGRVLLTTNAASAGVARQLFRAVVPLRVYQVATEPLPPSVVARIAPRRNPAADTRANLFTYRLDRDDRLISGGMAMLPVGAHGRMARMIVERLARELDLPEVPRIAHVWRGTAAMTPDFLPRIHEIGPGFLAGIGCNGRGIAPTAVLGEALADAATGTPPAELPIPAGPLRPIPLHLLAQAAPSLAIAQARWQDRHIA